MILLALSVASAHAETRKLKLYFLHTGERQEITFKRNGKYVDGGLKKINRFLRDWRRNEPTKMDPRLLDLVWEVYQEVGAKKHIHVVSAYRSPATNSMLRKRGRGVARKSQHTLGKAMDFFIPGVKLQTLRNAALKKGLGGVGYYPRSGSPFIHMDTGRVRHWPRMSRKELVKVFPSGKTLHVPTDGKPLKRYNQAKAEYDRKISGRGKIVVAKAEEIKKRPGFFNRLLGRDNEDEETSVAAATAPKPVRTTVQPVATPTPSTNVPVPSAPVPAAPVGETPILTSRDPIIESVESQIAALPASSTPIPVLSGRKIVIAQNTPEPQPQPNEQEPETIEVASQQEVEVIEPELPVIGVPVAAARPAIEPTTAPQVVEGEPEAGEPQETQIALLEPEVADNRSNGVSVPAGRPAEIQPQAPEPSVEAPSAETPATVEETTPTVIASAPQQVSNDFLDLRREYRKSIDAVEKQQAPTSIATNSEPVAGETQTQQELALLPIEPGVTSNKQVAFPVTNPERTIEVAVAPTPQPIEPGAQTSGQTAFPTSNPIRPEPQPEAIEVAAAPLEPIEPGTTSQGGITAPTSNPVKLAQQQADRLAAAFPEPIEPGALRTGRTAAPTTSPQRPKVETPTVVADAPLEPIEPGYIISGVQNTPTTSPLRPKTPEPVVVAAKPPEPIEPGTLSRGGLSVPSANPNRGRITLASLIEGAQRLEPIEPNVAKTDGPNIPSLSPDRVEKINTEIAAVDAQRRVAQAAAQPTSLVGFKSTVIDTDLLSRTSLASAQSITNVNKVRAPAYGKNIIREKPNLVLSQGFTQQGYGVNSQAFQGRAVQFLTFSKFN